jgi:hypothetical protein
MLFANEEWCAETFKLRMLTQLQVETRGQKEITRMAPASAGVMPPPAEHCAP